MISNNANLFRHWQVTILLCDYVYGSTSDSFSHPSEGQYLDAVVAVFLQSIDCNRQFPRG